MLTEILLEALGRNALYAAVLAIPVLLICRILGRRAPSLQEGLLWIVLLRLVLPPDLSAPWSPAAGVDGWLREATVVFSSPMATSPEPASVLQPELRPLELAPLAGSATTPSPLGTGDGLLWAHLALLGWLALAAIAVGRLLWRLRSWRRLARTADDVDHPDHRAALEVWRRRLQVSRPVRLVASPQIPAPFVTGWRRPIVALPRELSLWPTERLEPILAHELAHIARGDTLGVPLAALVRSLWFFHPAAALITGRLHQVREQLCDAAVLAAHCLPARRYGASLLAVASQRAALAQAHHRSPEHWQRTHRAPWPAMEPGPLHGTETDDSTPDNPPLSSEARRLKMRLEAILSHRSSRQSGHPLALFASRLAVLAIALIVLPMAAAGGGDAPPAPEPAPTPEIRELSEIEPAPPAPHAPHATEAPPVPHATEAPPAPPEPHRTAPAPKAAPKPPHPPRAPEEARHQRELQREEGRTAREQVRVQHEAIRTQRDALRDAQREVQERARDLRGVQADAVRQAREAERSTATDRRRAAEDARAHAMDSHSREMEVELQAAEARLQQEMAAHMNQLEAAQERVRLQFQARVEAGEIPNEEGRRRVEAQVEAQMAAELEQVRAQLETRRAEIEARAERIHRVQQEREHREHSDNREHREHSDNREHREHSDNREHREHSDNREHREHSDNREHRKHSDNREHQEHSERQEHSHDGRHRAPAADDAPAPRLVHPTPQARLTSGFGARVDPISKERKHHDGIDLAAPEGTPVVAAANGVVRIATDNLEGQSARGTVVVLEHDAGYSTVYNHLASLNVEPGQRVAPGQRIGSVGNTGASKGPHLHFEVHYNGEPRDPSTLLDSF